MRKLVVLFLVGIFTMGLMAKPPHKGGKHQYKSQKHYRKSHEKSLYLKGDSASPKAYTRGNKEASHLKGDNKMLNTNSLENIVQKR